MTARGARAPSHLPLAAQQLLAASKIAAAVMDNATGEWAANPTLGKSLGRMGAPDGRAIWGAAWPAIEAVLPAVLSGTVTTVELKSAGSSPALYRALCLAPLAPAFGMSGVHVVCLDLEGDFETKTRLTLQEDLFDAVRAAKTPDDVMAHVAQAICRQWNAALVGFARIDAGGAFRLDYLEQAEMLPRRSTERMGRLLRRLAGPEARNQLEGGRGLVVSALAGDDRPVAALRARAARLGLETLMIAPLLHNGTLASLLFVGDRRPRRWGDQDVGLLRDMAARTMDLVERLRAEREALEAKERIDLIEEAGDIGIFDWDILTGEQYRSAGVRRILGLHSAAPHTDEFAEALHPDDLEGFVDDVNRSLQNADRFTRQYRLRRPDGEIRWASTEAWIARDPDGTAARMTGIVRDITERKGLEEARERSERRQAFRTTLGDALRVPSSPLDVMEAAARTLADYFGVARVGLSDIDPDRGTVLVRRDLVDPARRAAGPVDLALFGGGFVDQLERGETVVVDDVETDPLTWPAREVYRRLDTRAMICVPILRNGRLVAIFDVTDPQPHDWTLEEVAAAEIVGERTGVAADRAAAETALRESERLLRAIGESSLDLIYAKDREGRLIYANAATLATIERTPDAMVGLVQHEFTRIKAEADAILANDRQVMEQGISGTFEEVFTSSDGRQTIYMSTKAPMLDGSGRVIGLAGVSRDVTTLRRAEEALVESEARFRTLAENIPILCWMAEPDGHIFWYNSRWYQFTGKTPEEMAGWGWQAVHDPQVLPRVLEGWQASLDNGEPFVMLFPLRGADGGYRTFLTKVAPIFDCDGRIVRWFGTNTDVTELENLRRTEALHDLIVESATDFAIITKDPNGWVTSWNPGAERLFGRSTADMIGAAIDPIFPAAAIAQGAPAEAREIARREGRAEYEGPVLRPDGETVWAQGVTMPLRDPAGDQIGYLVIVRDRTEQRRQDEHRQLLVDELNHRVKNTLAIVQGMAQQSFRNEPHAQAARSNFESRLAALASAHAILTREKWEAADLRDIVSDMVATHDPDGGRFVVQGPSARLSTQSSVTVAIMLHELVTNARKYGALSVPGGQVSLAWHLVAESPRRVALHWVETGGPLVEPPRRLGFGSKLIRRAFSVGTGSADLQFSPEGVTCTIEVVLA